MSPKPVSFFHTRTGYLIHYSHNLHDKKHILLNYYQRLLET